MPKMPAVRERHPDRVRRGPARRRAGARRRAARRQRGHRGPSLRRSGRRRPRPRARGGRDRPLARVHHERREALQVPHARQAPDPPAPGRRRDLGVPALAARASSACSRRTVVVALGATAAHSLFGRATPVGASRGQAARERAVLAGRRHGASIERAARARRRHEARRDGGARRRPRGRRGGADLREDETGPRRLLGLELPRTGASDFYPHRLPARRWLEHYAERFDTVEVNATFYRLPNRDAVAHWAEQVPPGFVFAVKASRYLTHIKRLTDLGRGMERFYERIEPLRSAQCLGPVLWQLPENFHRDDERLAGLLEAVPPGMPRAGVPSRELVRPGGDGAAARARRGPGPRRPSRSGPSRRPRPPPAWRFVRFHYGSRGRRGNYSRSELERWAQRLHRWRSRQEMFAYFNNDWEGFAPRNALWLAHRLEQLAAAA